MLHQWIQNFGRNIRFEAAHFYRPVNEQEVLEVLSRHATARIRAVGSLHSWSEILHAEEVVIDLSNLNSVSVEHRGPRKTVRIGAGCKIKRALRLLRRQGMGTLPTVGLIDEQTVAGAISTGTHGSGRHSFSHYVQSVRIATFDSVTNQPTILTIDSGSELKAARCGLGVLGVILDVTFECREFYRIEEHAARTISLSRTLELESRYPLQQFYYIPWLWEFFAQHRRESAEPISRLAPVYRVYWYLTLDVLLHVLIKCLAQGLRMPGITRWFYRRVMPWLVVRGWKVVDDAEKMLVMDHDLFRHIEIELFVDAQHLEPALELLRQVLTVFGGGEPEELLRGQLKEGQWQRLEAARGTYCHHYPICVRKVLEDDTFLSMSSGGTRYAISLISYESVKDRAGFLGFASLIAETMADRFDARPHWGKVFPLDRERTEQLYPQLDKFRSVCRKLDPEGRFCNEWTRRQLRLTGRDASPDTRPDE